MKNIKISGLLIKADEKHRGYSFTKECWENVGNLAARILLKTIDKFNCKRYYIQVVSVS